jgi:hypothetical protein
VIISLDNRESRAPKTQHQTSKSFRKKYADPYRCHRLLFSPDEGYNANGHDPVEKRDLKADRSAKKWQVDGPRSRYDPRDSS